MTVVVIEPISSGVTYLNAAQELGIDLYVFLLMKESAALMEQCAKKQKK